MKYKLINSKTKKEFLCSKVVIDGFDYYVSDYKPNQKDWFVNLKSKALGQHNGAEILLFKDDKKLIATNNPSIDIGQIIDIEILAEKDFIKLEYKNGKQDFKVGFCRGYNTHASTHTLSDDEVVEFLDWIGKNYKGFSGTKHYWSNKGKNSHIMIESKELLQLFKEQQIKTLMYE